MLTYTVENYRTQLKLAQEALAYERAQRAVILSPDWQRAKDYGEEVRVNHLRTNANRTSHYEKRVLELTLLISELEAKND